jgi:hypothetical protein
MSHAATASASSASPPTVPVSVSSQNNNANTNTNTNDIIESIPRSIGTSKNDNSAKCGSDSHEHEHEHEHLAQSTQPLQLHITDNDNRLKDGRMIRGPNDTRNHNHNHGHIHTHGHAHAHGHAHVNADPFNDSSVEGGNEFQVQVFEDNEDVESIATIRSSNVTATEYNNSRSNYNSNSRSNFSNRVSNNNNNDDNDNTNRNSNNGRNTNDAPQQMAMSDAVMKDQHQHQHQYQHQNQNQHQHQYHHQHQNQHQHQYQHQHQNQNQHQNHHQQHLRSRIPSPVQQFPPPSFILPQELKKILYEVSKTGKCSSLPWTASSRSPYFGTGSSSSEKKKRRAHLRNKKRYSSQSKIQRKKTKRPRENNNNNNSSGGGGCSGVNLNQLLPTASSLPSARSKNNHNNNNNLKNINGSTSSTSASASNTMITSGNIQQHQKQQLQSQSKQFIGNGEKYQNEGKYEKKQQQFQQQQQQQHLHQQLLHQQHLQQQAHQKGEDGDVSSISSTFSHASKKSFSSTTGTYKQQRNRYHHKDFHQSNYTSSCSESISSKGEGSAVSVPSSSASMAPLCLSLPFRTLRGALRLAVALVLEYSYKNRGGYKLSPAEKRRFEVLHQNSMKSSSLDGNKKQHQSPNSRDKNHFYGEYSVNPSQMDFAFTERRMRILQMLGGGRSTSSSSSHHHMSEYTSDSGSSLGSTKGSRVYDIAEGRQHCTGPPFTIQRVAEVLLMPERVSYFHF